jgi:hypothetical protein
VHWLSGIVIFRHGGRFFFFRDELAWISFIHNNSSKNHLQNKSHQISLTKSLAFLKLHGENLVMKKILITGAVVLTVAITLYQMGGSMTTFHHEIRTSAPPDTLWAILTNLEEVARYNPSVAHAAYIGDRNLGSDAARQCTLKDGSIVKERVVAASPSRFITMELYESSWPIDHMQWTTEIVPVDGGTLIKQNTRYEPRGIVGRLLNAVVMKRKMQSTITEVLTELGKYAEKR